MVYARTGHRHGLIGGAQVEWFIVVMVLLGSIKEGRDGNSGVEAKECVARAERIIERLIFG